MASWDLLGRRILITGGSAGLGRAMAEAMVGRGADVTAIARGEERLAELPRLGIKTLAGDANDFAFMEEAVRDIRPDVLILNAGAHLAMGSIDQLDFDAFSTNWNVDVKATLAGIHAAFRAPMTRGSQVLLMSSGAAMVLSSPHIPTRNLILSGGYLGAKYMVWFMAHDANAAAEERGLGVHFQALLPTRLIGDTALGRSVATTCAAIKGVTPEAYVAERYGTPLTPDHVGEQVADIIVDPRYRSGVAYGVTIEDMPVGLDT